MKLNGKNVNEEETVTDPTLLMEVNMDLYSALNDDFFYALQLNTFA